MNRFRKDTDRENKEAGKEGNGGFGKVLVSVLNGSFLTRENVIRQLPYLLFVAFLVVCYIGYGYYTEQTIKEIYQVEEELKELHSEYITTKSKLMYQSHRSEVVEMTRPLGLKESTEPPKKLVVPKEKLKQ